MEDIRYDGKLDYTIDNIGLVNVSRDENYTFAYKDGKERYSLLFVESGGLEYYFTETETTLRVDRGAVLFIPKQLPYRTRYLKNNTMIKILVFDIVADRLPFYLLAPISKKAAELAAVFDSISSQTMRNTTYLASKIYELLYRIEQETVTIPKKYKKIIPAVNEIKQAYFECRDLQYYADMCSMSQSNFRKLFKEYTGESLIAYRNRIRLAEARKMIDSGEFTVSEAAYLAGFNNMSFFYELYHRQFATNGEKSEQERY